MNTVDMALLLNKAQEGGYAVGAFNVENMEMALGVMDAAQELNAPVIFQTNAATVKYGNPVLYAGMLRALAQDAGVQSVVHLDHGNSVLLCKTAADCGYHSVMFDGSKLPLEENIRLSAEVAAYVHQLGICVEAELGSVGGKEDGMEADIAYTDPDEAVQFEKASAVDSIAVAIGTAHGFYHGEPKLNFELFKVLRDRLTVPLVMHGASGVSDRDIQKAVSLGISKINFATELRCAYTDAIRQVLLDKNVFDPKVYGKYARQAVKEKAMEKMILCGCAGKSQ